MHRLLLLAVACLALAGCASTPAPAETSQEAPGVITDPRDTAYLANATPGSHVHDYWQGRDSVQVLDETTGGGCFQYAGDQGLMARFQPPDGNIVPQGTGVVEVLVDWQIDEDTGPSIPGVPGTSTAFTSMELWVKRAPDAEASLVAEVQDGVALRFNSTNQEDDPPHYVLSLWEFQVVAVNEGADSTSFCGTFHVQATAFRTLPLEVFPPHPDRWNGSSELPLRAIDVNVQLHTGLVVTYSCFNGCADITFGPDDGLVVPHDANEVLVTVTTDTASTPVPFALQVHGADTRAFADVVAETDEPFLQVFRVPADARGDSPYAAQSLWEFRVHMSTPMDQGAWTGSYHVTAVALK